jgi:hypothetical protein
MKLSAFVLSCLLLFSAFSASAQKNVQATSNEDADEVKETVSKVQREVYDAAKYPALAAVGRINFMGGSWCSIILVGEDLAVTAGHCILKANFKFDVKKQFEPSWTSVNFKPDGVRRIEGVSIKRVLKAKLTPDYAIVRLNRKIPESEIKPLQLSSLSLDELRSSEAQLGCAGFNGDRELGSGGLLMTISRNVRIIPESSSKGRVDTSCFSTYGGSGGLFYRRQTDADAYDFLGVIWGLTDEKPNEKGEWVKLEEVITSVTPVSAFQDELEEIIEKDERTKNGKNGTENTRN